MKKHIGEMKAEQMVNRYSSLRTLLVFEGLLVGVFAGLVSTLYRFALGKADEIRDAALSFCTGNPLRIAGWFVVLAVLAAALNWTPINYQTLFGMQGRYLLPVLPLALLLWKNNRLVAMWRSAAHGAALSVALLTLLTQLQGFALYASWQPVS